eukprot:g1569.t1
MFLGIVSLIFVPQVWAQVSPSDVSSTVTADLAGNQLPLTSEVSSGEEKSSIGSSFRFQEDLTVSNQHFIDENKMNALLSESHAFAQSKCKDSNGNLLHSPLVTNKSCTWWSLCTPGSCEFCQYGNTASFSFPTFRRCCTASEFKDYVQKENKASIHCIGRSTNLVIPEEKIKDEDEKKKNNKRRQQDEEQQQQITRRSAPRSKEEEGEQVKKQQKEEEGEEVKKQQKEEEEERRRSIDKYRAQMKLQQEKALHDQQEFQKSDHNGIEVTFGGEAKSMEEENSQIVHHNINNNIGSHSDEPFFVEQVMRRPHFLSKHQSRRGGKQSSNSIDLSTKDDPSPKVIKESKGSTGPKQEENGLFEDGERVYKARDLLGNVIHY